MRILHVGCGRKKYSAGALLDYVGLSFDDADTRDAEVLHMDADPDLQPDIVCKLGRDVIPLDSDSIDLVIAWHVLEHVGKQGETREWFMAWEDLYRVLRHDGIVYAESPYWTSIWTWSDPTHTRSISEHSLIFFMQDAYRAQGSMISPYRIACDFVWLGMAGMERGYAVIPDRGEPRHSAIRFALRARKPLAPWWADVADGKG